MTYQVSISIDNLPYHIILHFLKTYKLLYTFSVMNPIGYEQDNQIDKQLKTMLVKNTDFFGDGKRYKLFEDDEAARNAS